MRLAMAQPCLGSSEMVFRIKRSSVPWTRSFGFAILWLSTIVIFDCQGMTLRQVWAEVHTARSLRSAAIGRASERTFPSLTATVFRTAAPMKHRIALEPNLSQELWKFL